MAQDSIQATGLDVALTGFLDFLSRVLPQETLSIDAEAARKHCVELIHTLNTTESDRPPELPPRPVGIDGDTSLRARSTPDCRVDDSNEIDGAMAPGSRLSQHSILTDMTSGDESFSVPGIGETMGQVSVHWSGHLNQGSKKDGSIRMSWNRRWCVIVDVVLYCYKTANDPVPINEYSLLGSQIFPTSDGEVDKAHSFKVIQKGAKEAGVLYFAVFVADDLQSCIQAFTAAAKGIRMSVGIEYQLKMKPTSPATLVGDEIYQRPRPTMSKPVLRPPGQKGRSSSVVTSTPLSFTSGAMSAASGPLSAASGPLSATSDTSGPQRLDYSSDPYEELEEAETQARELERTLQPQEGVAELPSQPKRKPMKSRSSTNDPECVYEELDFLAADGEVINSQDSPEEYSGTTPSSSDTGEKFVREARKGGVRSSGKRLKEMIYGRLRSSKRSNSEVKRSALEKSAIELVDSTLSGYLMKKDSTGSTWRRRWCVVKDICFYYFRTEEQAKPPQLAVVLRGWTIRPYDADPKHPYAFQISHKGVLPYCFAAESSERKEEWMKAILAAINLEALPPTPSEGRNRKYNELEEERLLKAVQRLGTDALVSPSGNPPPLPNRSSLATISSAGTTDSLYDQLGPPRPVPTPAEMRPFSLSSMANENDLYNEENAASHQPDPNEVIYNIPRRLSVEQLLENSHRSGSEDDETHYEPLDVQPLPCQEKGDEKSDGKPAGAGREDPISPHEESVHPEQSNSTRQCFSESEKMDDAVKDMDEADGFRLRSITLPTKITTGVASIPERPAGQNRPLRPSSIASGAIEIDGYLFKRSRRFHRWVLRYCKVRSKKFFYYRNKDEPHVDEFRLLGHELKIPQHSEVKRPFCFQIVGRKPSMRNLTFAVDNQEDFDLWTEVLSNACSIQVHQVDDISEIYVKGSGPVQTRPLAVVKEMRESRDELDAPDGGPFKIPSDCNIPVLWSSKAVTRSQSVGTEARHTVLETDLTISEEALDLAVPSKKSGKPKKKGKGWLYISLRRSKKKIKSQPTLSESFHFQSQKEIHVPEDGASASSSTTGDKQMSNASEARSTQSAQTKELVMSAAMPTAVPDSKPTVKSTVKPVQSPEFKPVLVPTVSDVPPSTSAAIEKKPVVRSVTDPTDTRSPGTFRKLSDKLRLSRRKKRVSQHEDPQPSPSKPKVISNLLRVQNSKGLSRSLTQHWCVVQDSYLFCYKNNGDSKPAVSVSLVSGRVERYSSDEDLKKGHYLFRVVPNNDTDAGEFKPVVLCADAESELNKWVGEIEKHIEEVTLDAVAKGLESSRSRADSLIIPNPTTLTESAVHTDALLSQSSQQSDQRDSIGHPPYPPERPSPRKLLMKMPPMPPDDEVYFREDELSVSPPKSATKNGSSPQVFREKGSDDQNDSVLPYYIAQTDVEPGPRSSDREQENQENAYLKVEDGEENNEQVVDHGQDEKAEGTETLPSSPSEDGNGNSVLLPNNETVRVSDSLSDPDSSQGDSTCEGWLYKKTMIGTWSERYCRLTEGELCHYKNETDKKPILSMNMSGCQVCYSTREKGRHVIRIMPPNRSNNQLLSSAERDEITKWLHALKRAAKQTDVVKKTDGSNGGAITVLKESPSRWKPRRSHTFNAGDKTTHGEHSPKPALAKSYSTGEKKVEDRIGKISIEKGIDTRPFFRHYPNAKTSQMSTTSSSDGDLCGSTPSFAEMRKSVGKGKKKKKLKVSEMIDTVNVPASSMMDAYYKGTLYQKVGTTAAVWIKRWCALKELCLYVYRHANDDQPVESILLPGWEVILTKNGPRKNVIKIWHPQMKSYHFMADRSDHMHWFSCLQEAALLKGRVGDLVTSKSKAYAASSTSVSSSGTVSSFEDFSSKGHESSPDPKLSGRPRVPVHASVVRCYEEEMQKITLKHEAVGVQLSTRHDALKLDIYFLKKKIDELQQIIDKCTLEKSENVDMDQMKQELEHLSLQFREADHEMKELEDKMKANKEEEFRALKDLQEQQTQDLSDAVITSTGTLLSIKEYVGLQSRDSPGVRPSDKVHHEVQDYEQKSESAECV